MSGGTQAVDSQGYVAGIQRAVANGCNVLDTAVNYRFMQSERDIGLALSNLFNEGLVRRDELVICTKGGIIPFNDAPHEEREEYLRESIYAANLAQPQDVAGNVHCLAPDFLSNQIGVSLNNLRLGTIDVYYIHNPEIQLDYVTPQEFRRRIRAAFARLEEEAASGRIRFYGISAQDGLLAAQADRGYLPLSLFVQIAREVGGESHRFRFVQFPYNLHVLDAVVESNQVFDTEKDGQKQRLNLPLLAVARQHALVTVSSTTLDRGKLLGHVPGNIKPILGDLSSDAQYAIQFNRSTPGLTTTLVGMGSVEHAIENLAVAQKAIVPPDVFFSMFGR
ncbi:MAG: aldo/keto reductase [Caldilineaceae bacterium]|nr:aldo/keto reductase [Caldilineaceae bacterium]